MYVAQSEDETVKSTTRNAGAQVWRNGETAQIAGFILTDGAREKRCAGMAALAIEQASAYAQAHDEDHGSVPPLDRYLLGRSLRGWLAWRLTSPVDWQDDDREAIEQLKRQLVEASLGAVDWDALAEDILDRFGSRLPQPVLAAT
jgi:hypothetical protein